MKLKHNLSIAVLFFVLNSFLYSQQFVQLNQDEITKVKQSLKDGTASVETQKAYKRLLSYVDSLMDMKNPSVTHKTLKPPTNDMHDYLSISRYWWPDTDNKDGLPWIRKDGETNPDTQTDKVDRNRLGKMTEAVRAFGLAYYFTDNDAYAKKGVSIIKTWFLEEETLMNPHLKFAQSIPGRPGGRKSGILDGRLIPLSVLDALVLFSNSDYWTPTDNANMNTWLNEYLVWLTESPLGLSGASQKNNHGSWYKFHVAAVAWYLGNKSLTIKMIDLTKRSLDDQFDRYGAQVHELKRTRSFFYSCFNLDALTRIAIIGDKAGIDLWEYQTPEGKNLKLAIDYLMSVAKGEEWNYPNKGIDLSLLAPLLERISTKTDSEEYSLLLKTILKEISETEHLKGHQLEVYENFALLKPELFE